MRGFGAAAFVCVSLACAAQEKLQVRYFYDKSDERLAIAQLRFLTKERAIAVGTLINLESGAARGTLLSSSDGGANWTLEPLKEIPKAMSFIDESFGWMATEGGIWRTEEGGRSWKKIKSQKGLLAIHFLDAQRGWAAGAPKLLLETKNGGKDWSPVAEAAKPETKAENSFYSVIGFATPKNGIIAGASIAPRAQRGRGRLPAWMDPEEAKLRTQRPTVLLSLETYDGGEQWKSSTASIFGRPSKIALVPGTGFVVFQYDDSFDWPSEVYRLAGAGKTASVFREKDRRTTDLLIQKSATVYMAAVQPATPTPGVPIPGRVHLMRSTGVPYTLWERINVDYRAVANQVCLAEAPDGTIWAATDEGMILSLSH